MQLYKRSDHIVKDFLYLQGHQNRWQELCAAWESSWVKVHKSFSRQKVECPQLFYSNTVLCMWIFRIFHPSHGTQNGFFLKEHSSIYPTYNFQITKFFMLLCYMLYNRYTVKLHIPYTRHYNPLLIWNHSWLLGSKIEEFPCLVHKLFVISTALYNINRSAKWSKKYTSRGL